MTSRRLERGGSWIDRSRPVSFRLDGRELVGFEGDTLASALLANGAVGGFASPIAGRPRGVLSAGPEEPNAFVAVLEPWVDVIAPATMVPLVDGLVAERRSGVARLPEPGGPAPDVRRLERHFETLVVGAGPAGRAAAREAAERGDRVLLVDERHTLEDPPSGEDLTVLPNATALGVYDQGFVVVHERTRSLERIWHVRAANVVLATGALERPIAFAGNDLPGVMLAGAVRAYVERFGVRPGGRAAVFTTNAWGLEAADVLRAAGVEVVRTLDARTGESVVAARGDEAVREVVVRDAGGETPLEVDLLAVSGGWNPNHALWRAIGGGLHYDEERACFLPDGGPPWLSVTGSAAGELPSSAPLWFVEDGDDAAKYIDLQRDQTVADVAHALGRGLRSVEHVKRATYIGTAVDQGRTSGVLAAEIVSRLLGDAPGAQGPSNARPPSVPVSFAALAGPFRGERFDPVRTAPIHPWHAEHGAVFMDTGQWQRPKAFPRDGEPIERAVERECLAVRNAVGVMDASTLGKIEVVGPDAATFLDRMYTNRMSNLAVGRIRYGLMLGLDGMVWDDGVAMRVAEDRFYVTTTTGGAAAVLDRFEEWLQTEWTDLRVFCTSVTEQWAVVVVAGPRARDVLAAAGTDVDLAREAFPFMAFRDGRVGSVPARIARVSFSGELAFELQVPAWHGLETWEAVLAAGEPFGIEPYGLDALEILRAEKGYIVVGQETDGTVTPDDLGMGWIVDLDKGDFLGRRSLRRPELVRNGRRQLVGLLPLDPSERIPEGAYLVLEDTGEPPMATVGHVTSSYRSPTLGRAFALGLVADGRALNGRTLYAPLPDRTIATTVTAPVFYDPEGARRGG